MAIASVLDRVKSFWNDITDKSAAKVRSPRWATESLTTVGIAVLGASAQIEAVRKVGSEFVGDFSSLFQLVLQLFAIFWCMAVISGKSELASGSAIIHSPASASPQLLYSYSQPLRFLAKVGLLLLMFLIPVSLRAVADEVIPLPSTIYGYIYRGADHPLDGVRVRIITREGQDITRGNWFTDSAGFYIATANRRIKRSDKIVVAPEECDGEHALSLMRSNQADNSTIMSDAKVKNDALFVHHIDCKEK